MTCGFFLKRDLRRHGWSAADPDVVEPRSIFVVDFKAVEGVVRSASLGSAGRILKAFFQERVNGSSFPSVRAVTVEIAGQDDALAARHAGEFAQQRLQGETAIPPTTLATFVGQMGIESEESLASGLFM